VFIRGFTHLFPLSSFLFPFSGLKVLSLNKKITPLLTSPYATSLPWHIATVKQNTPPHGPDLKCIEKKISLIFRKDSGNNLNALYDLFEQLHLLMVCSGIRLAEYSFKKASGKIY